MPKKPRRRTKFSDRNPKSVYGKLFKKNLMPPVQSISLKRGKAGRHENFTPQQVIAALYRNNGRQHLAARDLGCCQSTLCNMKKRYPEIQTVIDALRGECIDEWENKLDEAARAGQPWAICFGLKTQAKDRGYIERVQNEMSGRDGQPIETRIDVTERAARVAGILGRLRAKGAFGLPGRAGADDPIVDPDAGTADDRVQQ